MKVSFRLSSSLAAVLGVVVIAVASAQARPPAATSSATAGASASSSADSAAPNADSAAPTAESAAPTAAASSTLGLPPGHPPVGQPSGDANGSAGAPRLPAQSSVEADPSLPRNTIAVELVDESDQPLEDHPIRLSIMRQGRGPTPKSLKRRSDGSGNARFDGLATSPDSSYRVSTKRGRAVFASPPFNLSAATGIRVRLHAYPPTSDLEQTHLGVQSVVVLEIKENAIAVSQMFAVFNFGPTAYVPRDLSLTLPEDYQALSQPEEMSDVAIRELGGRRIQLAGTFAPGRTTLSFSYRLPLRGRTEQSLVVPLPPRVAQSQVLAAIAPPMQLTVAGYPPAQATRDANGRTLLVTEQQLGGEPTPSLQITLRGLPKPGPGRLIALGLAMAAIIVGAGYAYGRRRGRYGEHVRADLERARDVILEHLAELETVRRHDEAAAGERLDDERSALLEALSRIIATLEAEQKGEVDSPRP